MIRQGARVLAIVALCTMLLVSGVEETKISMRSGYLRNSVMECGYPCHT